MHITRFWATDHNAQTNSTRWPIAHNQILCHGHIAQTKSTLWPIAHYQISLSTLVKRGGALFPLPLPSPGTLATRPHSPQLSPPSRVQYELGHKMGGDGSASGGSRQCNATCLTARLSASGRLLPPLSSVTSCLLDLYCSVWTMVAGRGYCTMRVAVWRSSPSY
jgi:hypothetical protein